MQAISCHYYLPSSSSSTYVRTYMYLATSLTGLTDWRAACCKTWFMPRYAYATVFVKQGRHAARAWCMPPVFVKQGHFCCHNAGFSGFDVSRVVIPAALMLLLQTVSWCCCYYFPVLVSRGRQCSFYSWLVSYTCWRAVGRGHYSYSGLFRYSCLLRSRRRGHLQSGKVGTGTPRNRLQLAPAGAFPPIRALDFVSTLDYKRGDSP